MNSRICSPFYVFFLNPVYVAARSRRSLRSNDYLQAWLIKGIGHLSVTTEKLYLDNKVSEILVFPKGTAF